MHLAQYYNGYHNMMDSSDYGWGLLMMFLWALVIVGVVVFIVRSVCGRDVGSGKDDALAIAKKRYANGEITKEQFEQIKKDLQ